MHLCYLFILDMYIYKKKSTLDSPSTDDSDDLIVAGIFIYKTLLLLLQQFLMTLNAASFVCSRFPIAEDRDPTPIDLMNRVPVLYLNGPALHGDL